jgi:hypothetical protein
MAVHLGVERPPEPLQTTVMDYAFKFNVLAGHLEREVAPPDDDDDGGLYVSGIGSDSDSNSDGGALRWRLLVDLRDAVDQSMSPISKGIAMSMVAVHNELQCACQKFDTLFVSLYGSSSQ